MLSALPWTWRHHQGFWARVISKWCLCVKHLMVMRIRGWKSRWGSGSSHGTSLTSLVTQSTNTSCVPGIGRSSKDTARNKIMAWPDPGGRSWGALATKIQGRRAEHVN